MFEDKNTVAFRLPLSGKLRNLWKKLLRSWAILQIINVSLILYSTLEKLRKIIFKDNVKHFSYVIYKEIVLRSNFMFEMHKYK